MTIDIHTLIAILAITHLIQLVVFIHQFRMNKTYQGIGWWLLWSATEVLGFLFMLLRDRPALFPVAVIGQNTLIVLGTIFLYIGVMRFLDKKENLRIIIPGFTLYLAALSYFLFINNHLIIRSVIICATLAGISFVTAYCLFKNKPPSIAASADFNAVIFLLHGGIFTHRTVMILAGTPVNDFFVPTLFNYLPYLDALIVSLLWTFGLIIMLNQRLNAEIVEAKEHFELIFNTGPDGALITRVDDGVILDVNAGFTALTGFTRAESIGASSLSINIWKNPADRQRIVAELRKNGFCENFEAEFVRKDGSRIIGLMSAKIIMLRGTPHIISVTRDISDRKQAEKEIHKLNAELEKRVAERTVRLEAANQELATFTYSIAHDLRTPLRAISGFSQIINEDYMEKLDDEARSLLDTVRTSANKMGQLIDDLLEFARTGRGELGYVKIDMTALADSICREITATQAKKGLECVVAKLPEAWGDQGLLYEVWVKLINNAVKFTEPKKTRRIEIGGYSEPGGSVYFVKDNGVGFDPAYMDKLFGVFQRLHSVEEFEGTGVGLAIVKRIIERHGGRVWAESEVDKGASFFFSIPKKRN